MASLPAPRTYIGIDSSLTCTGLAAIVLREGEPPEWHTTRIKSKAPPKDVAGRFYERERRVQDIVDLAQNWLYSFENVVEVCIESPAYSSTSGSIHDRASLWWELYRLARNVRLRDPDGSTYHPLTATPQARMTIATGRGNAGKEEVMAATIRRFLDADVPDDNVADAVNLVVLAAEADGHSIVTLPKPHLRALDKLTR